MKATLFASVVLLSFMVTLPSQAAFKQASPGLVATNSKPVSKINLNTADIRILSHSIKGIGIKRAEAIINYRQAHNGFKSVEELSQVKGISKRFVKTHLSELQELFVVNK